MNKHPRFGRKGFDSLPLAKHHVCGAFAEPKKPSGDVCGMQYRLGRISTFLISVELST
jgi:hypothetical protein